MLKDIIEWRYPAAKLLTNYHLRDDADGEGPKIVHWDEQAIGAPQPTVDELLAHEDEWRLDTAQRAKIAAIDARSQALLTAGLEVAEGVRISTSTEAQINFLAFRDAVKSGHLSPPQGFSTLDDGEFVIETAEQVEDIYAMWLAHKKDILDAGRALRLAVLAAETVEAVEAITDERE